MKIIVLILAIVLVSQSRGDDFEVSLKISLPSEKVSQIFAHKLAELVEKHERIRENWISLVSKLVSGESIERVDIDLAKIQEELLESPEFVGKIQRFLTSSGLITKNGQVKLEGLDKVLKNIVGEFVHKMSNDVRIESMDSLVDFARNNQQLVDEILTNVLNEKSHVASLVPSAEFTTTSTTTTTTTPSSLNIFNSQFPFNNAFFNSQLSQIQSESEKRAQLMRQFAQQRQQQAHAVAQQAISRANEAILSAQKMRQEQDKQLAFWLNAQRTATHRQQQPRVHSQQNGDVRVFYYV